jgi:hypothetical protein
VPDPNRRWFGYRPGRPKAGGSRLFLLKEFPGKKKPGDMAGLGKSSGNYQRP